MKRLTTDKPEGNVENSLNLFYIKDQWTWVRGGGPAPDYKDVSLCDLARMMVKANIPDTELPKDDDNLSMMMHEWLMDEPDTAEGIIALLYNAGWAFAELRQRLAAYEDTGLTPEDLKPGLNAAARKKLACEYFGLSTSQVSHIEGLVQADKDGKLEVLPCKVGDLVWGIRSYKSGKMAKPGRVTAMYYAYGMQLHITVERICTGVWGKNVFPTYEEAEKVLKGAQGGAHEDS